MYLWFFEKRLVSSANIIGSNKKDAFSRSLTYTRNSSGPRINPKEAGGEAPQVIYLRSVLLF